MSAPGLGPAASNAAAAGSAFTPEKVEHRGAAMGTSVTFIAYTTPSVDRAAVLRALQAALVELERLEALLSNWRPTSEISRLNGANGSPFPLSPETFEVLDRSLWASRLSDGAFDITFEALSPLWRFGDDATTPPTVPTPAQVAERRRFVDYQRLQLDPAKRTATLPTGFKVGVGGIAKGFVVDRAAQALKAAGLRSFLAQAGGDLYGAGRRPDGTPWVSGIQDPRAASGTYFAVVELTDHAFSTAGDYARSFMVNGKRYHHILDPRTGAPATACRSVTVWAPDAFTADAIDDAVFILGPERGLRLVESLPDAGAVIVDAHNVVHISPRLQGRVRLLAQPTDGP